MSCASSCTGWCISKSIFPKFGSVFHSLNATHYYGNCCNSLWQCNCSYCFFNPYIWSASDARLAAFFLHASGFFFRYVLARMLGIDMACCQTISIEVGMQIIVIIYRSISKTEKLLILSKSDSLQRSTSIIECRKANAYS